MTFAENKIPLRVGEKKKLSPSAEKSSEKNIFSMQWKCNWGVIALEGLAPSFSLKEDFFPFSNISIRQQT